MRMQTILGGVASSAVIVAMAVVYMTAEVRAAVDPLEINSNSERFLQMEPSLAMPAIKSTVRPRQRPNAALPKHVYNKDQLYCLAQNIYFESRGESYEGQAAVAWVTLNRMMNDQFPSTICKVVWQRKQFSWTHDGRSDTPRDDQSWERAQVIALDVVDNYDPDFDPTVGSTYFHERSISPGWSKKFERVGRIDNHVFYADRG
jgi:spore germination cell wall hydrolase CwlJ-like protein